MAVAESHRLLYLFSRNMHHAKLRMHAVPENSLYDGVVNINKRALVFSITVLYSLKHMLNIYNIMPRLYSQTKLSGSHQRKARRHETFCLRLCKLSTIRSSRNSQFCPMKVRLQTPYLPTFIS